MTKLAEFREEANQPAIEAAYAAVLQARRDVRDAAARAKIDAGKATRDRLRRLLGLTKAEDVQVGVDSYRLSTAAVARLLALLDPDHAS